MTPASKVKGNKLISGGVESPSETLMFCISKTSSLEYTILIIPLFTIIFYPQYIIH